MININIKIEMEEIYDIDLDKIFDDFKLDKNIKKVKLIRTKDTSLKIGDKFLRETNITHLYTNNLINVNKIGNDFLFICNKLIYLDFSGFKNVKIIGNHFLSGCYKLTHFDSSGFKNVKQIGNYFLFCCKNLTHFDSSGFVNVNQIGNNFLSCCDNLTHFDSSGFNNVNQIGDNFSCYCNKIEDIQISSNNNVSSNYLINFLKIKFSTNNKLKKDINWIKRNISLLIREHSKNKMYDAFSVWNIMTNVALYLE